MLQLDLTTLNGAELRSLLDTARERGAAHQSYLILQEMARRRESGGLKPLRRRQPEPGEPRFIALDLGDPLDRLDAEDEAEREDELRIVREPDPDPPPRRRWSVGVFSAGALAGVIVGAFAGSIGEAFLRPSSELAQFRADVAADPPPPAAPQVPDAPLVAPAELAESPPPAPPGTEVAETPATAPAADVAAQDAAAAAEAPAEPPQAEIADAAPAPERRCPGAVTPADRAICGDAELEALQRDLRRSYAAALAAHADRALLRERQLAWRDARNGISDPGRLAGLYRARIRKLDAATADARRQP